MSACRTAHNKRHMTNSTQEQDKGQEQMASHCTFGRFFGQIAVMLTVAVALALQTTPLAAETKVVALVNDDPITSYDVRNRSKFMAVTSGKPANAATRAAALDELIEEQLKLQEAKRLGISVRDEAIEQSYAQIASRLKMTPAKLTAAFRQVGVNANTLRQRIRADLLWNEVVRARFRQEVQVREQDVLVAIGGRESAALQKTTEFDLHKIIVILPRDPSNAVVAERTRVAERFRERFQSCDQTHDLSRQFDGVVWDRFGRHVLAKFDAEDQTRLGATDINQVTPPRRTANALEMYAVCGKREVEDDTAARREAQGQIAQERGTVLARRLLIDLKQSAVIVRR